MFTPEFLEAIGKLVSQVGIPMALLIGYILKDWYFTTRMVEHDARMLTIMEAIQRDGVKCRHD